MSLSTVARLGALVVLAACASTGAKPDPRVGLAGGVANAAEAAGNLKVVAKAPTPSANGFDKQWNSDIAFLGQYAIQGSFNGLEIWDMADVANPKIVTALPCAASQNDVSVFRNLLFMSVESGNTPLVCGDTPVTDSVSPRRFRGIRIFDVTDIRNPKIVANVQTCRGSHTHTVLEDPKDKDNVYVYISGSAGIRSPNELPGCVTDPSDPRTALFRIEVIKVPVANPGNMLEQSS